MSTTDIESTLRQAPRPKPPGILKQQLKAQALRAPRLTGTAPAPRRSAGSWLGRWWPALAPTAVSLACAAVLAVQQAELQELKQKIAAPAQPAVSSQKSTSTPAGSSKNNVAANALSVSEQDELTRLKALAANLGAEISKLEQMRAENEKVRAQLASASAAVLTPEETQALEQARDRALSIQCSNNLKQLGLAVRVWALDNGDLTPPNVLCMSNEMGSFKILVCPADSGRQAAKDSSSFTTANCSYEYLAPSAPETEPDRIMFRCPIHGSVCLLDGSVQMEVAKKHPEQIVQRDGKLYFGPSANEGVLPPQPANQNQ